MAISVKDLEAALPGHYIVGGEAIVFHGTKHVVLGKYVGDDLVVLSKEGETLLASLAPAAEEAPAEVRPRSPRSSRSSRSEKAPAEVTAHVEAAPDDAVPADDELDLDD